MFPMKRQTKFGLPVGHGVEDVLRVFLAASVALLGVGIGFDFGWGGGGEGEEGED